MQSYPFTSRVTYDDEGLPLYDRAIDSKFLRQVFAQYFSDGVFYKPANALQVVADTGMQIKVNPGACHIQGAVGIEDKQRTLAVQASESLDRIDTVVARLDLSQAVRSIDLYVRKGTAAASPHPPTLTRDSTVWELGLANLFIAKNVGTISQQRITDTRLDDTRCGLVAQTIGDLDTEPYYTQLQAIINDLQEVIEGIELGSEVMLKTTYDPDKTGVIPITHGGTGANSAAQALKNLGSATAEQGTKADNAMPKAGGTFTGWLEGGADNVGMKWTTADGTTFFVKAYKPSNQFQITRKTSGGSEEGVLSVQKGSASFNGHATSATTATNAKNNFFGIGGGGIDVPGNRIAYYSSNAESGKRLMYGVIGNQWALAPEYVNNTYLGTSGNKWNSVYATNGAIQTSDQNLKERIEAIDARYLKLFSTLRPVSYAFRNGAGEGDGHDRLHLGFIAQEVEEAMAECGITPEEFGGFCRDVKTEPVQVMAKRAVTDPENGDLLGTEDVLLDDYAPVTDEQGQPVYIYSLRYSEFIALNTAAIQMLSQEQETLKSTVRTLEERLNRLEGTKQEGNV